KAFIDYRILKGPAPAVPGISLFIIIGLPPLRSGHSLLVRETLGRTEHFPGFVVGLGSVFRNQTEVPGRITHRFPNPGLKILSTIPVISRAQGVEKLIAGVPEGSEHLLLQFVSPCSIIPALVTLGSGLVIEVGQRL